MAKNNKTRFFYVLYSDKTRVFEQSERAYCPIYIIKNVEHEESAIILCLGYGSILQLPKLNAVSEEQK